MTNTPKPSSVGIQKLLAIGRRVPTWAMIVVMAVVLVSLVVVGANQGEPVRPPIQLASTGTQTPDSVDPTSQSQPPQLAELSAAIAEIEDQYRTSIGVGIAPVASPGKVVTTPWQGGTLVSAPAWRTIDVAIALAVSQSPRQPQDLGYLLDRSVTQDSLAGDQALWQFLGTPDQAISATGDVLRSAGDSTTVLPEDANDPFAVFSQVGWTQVDAAQFMGVLFCMPRSWPVLSYMAPDSPDGFGLATLTPSLARTSRGTSIDPRMPGVGVRQVGLLRLADGHIVGVSLAAIAEDSTLDTAEMAATAVANLLKGITGFDGQC